MPHIISSRKGQIQIGEIMAVLIVFMILLVMSMLFFSQMGTQSSMEKIEETHRLELLEVAKELVHMPEIRCQRFEAREDNCLEKERVRALQRAINTTNTGYDPAIRQYYRERFQALRNEQTGYSVYIVSMYPELYTSSGDIDPALDPRTPSVRAMVRETVFSFPPPNWNENTGAFSDVYIPIVVRNEFTTQDSFALLHIRQHKLGLEEVQP